MNYSSDPFGTAGEVNPFPSRPPTQQHQLRGCWISCRSAVVALYVNPHLRTPYIYQYNLSVQRETLEGHDAGGVVYRIRFP